MIKQIPILSGVIGLVGATSFSVLTPVSAALTPPSSYDIAFAYSGTSLANWYLQADTSAIYGDYIQFNRTADGAYYNYTATFDNNTLSTIPEGLSITNTFNRSNTSWSSAFGGYYPTDTKIGSDATVGSIASKYILQFNNQTSNNYFLSLDVSSSLSGTTHYHTLSYDDVSYPTFSNIIRSAPASLINFYIPSFTNTIINMSSTSNAIYLDAWYLDDLGVSVSYQQGETDGYYEGQEDGFDLGYGEGYEEGNADGYNEGQEDGFDSGYDEGYSDGSDFGYSEAILNNGILSIITNVFSGMAGIFGISILGGITLGTLTLLPLLGMVLFFFKKFIQ
jgi:hypothetical protein